MNDVNDIKKKIEVYLRGSNNLPYFISVEGRRYVELRDYLRELPIVRVSDFCRGDTFSDDDDIFNTAQTLESDSVLLGVGEMVSLSDDAMIIHRLRAYRFPKKLIVLCRNIKTLLVQLGKDYPQFRRTLSFVESVENFSVIQYSPSLQEEDTLQDFSKLLHALEDGAMGTLKVTSALPLKNVSLISKAYDALKIRNPKMRAPEKVLTNEQWLEVLHGSTKYSRYLAGFERKLPNAYERCVFDHSSNFDAFERNIFYALLREEPDTVEHRVFYRLRKPLLTNFDEKKYLPGYIEAVKARGADGIYYLTDNTLLEFQAATELVLLNPDKRDVYAQNFPAAQRYLQKFRFADERLTNYFECYKDMKLFGICSKGFLAQVALYAQWRIYNELETRAALLERIGDGALYWMDGLSLDLLGYFRQRMTELGLQATIQIARAELPTLTSVNKTFYEEWPFRKFPKNERLDKLHHEARKDSVYFCDEISIIEDALNEIATSLRSGDTAKVILTSDHGSSRGVVRCRGHPIKMHVSGEHGGRCCKIDERDVKPEFAVEANGYYVLTNYDRIQGGRMDGVELHGGATLEEVLVPVIEIFI